MASGYMTPSSYDELKDLPRVASADSTLVPKDRGHPALKHYRKDDKTYSLAEVVARANARIEGELPPIPGGLDDTNPALYGKGGLGGIGKMKPVHRGALTEDQIKMMENGERPADPKPDAPSPPSIEERSKPELVSEDDDLSPTELPPPPERQIQPVVYSTEELLHGRKRSRKQQVQIVERIVERPVEKVVEKVVEVEKPSAAKAFLERRTRVQIATSETMFSIPAITVVPSLYGLVVVLPLRDDSVTFIPKTGSKVRVSCKDLGTYDTTYTGVSFEIEELGIMGLCFLVPDGTGAREKNGEENA